MSHPLPGGKPWAPADSRPGAASSPSRPSSPRPRHRKWVNGVFKNSNSRELNGDSGAGFPEHRPHSPSSRAVLAPPTLPRGGVTLCVRTGPPVPINFPFDANFGACAGFFLHPPPKASFSACGLVPPPGTSPRPASR